MLNNKGVDSGFWHTRKLAKTLDNVIDIMLFVLYYHLPYAGGIFIKIIAFYSLTFDN